MQQHIRVVVALGAQSSITEGQISDALKKHFLDCEFAVLKTGLHDNSHTLTEHAYRVNPEAELWIGLQGGTVAIIENGVEKPRRGEFASFAGPDCPLYSHVIEPDIAFIEQRAAKKLKVKLLNPLPVARPPTDILLSHVLQDIDVKGISARM